MRIGVVVEERDALVEPVQHLVTSRRALLKNTIAANTEYLRALAELDFQENRLQATASEFDSYLVERLLCVRNRRVIGINTMVVLPAEVIDFLHPQPWLEAFRALTVQATQAPWLGFVFLLSGIFIRAIFLSASC